MSTLLGMVFGLLLYLAGHDIFTGWFWVFCTWSFVFSYVVRKGASND